MADEKARKLAEEKKKEQDVPMEAVDGKGKRKKRHVAAQGELEFDSTPSRFTRSSPSVRGAEDLDRPTFQRKGIKLRV